jgi:hypothetical protein
MGKEISWTDIFTRTNKRTKGDTKKMENENGTELKNNWLDEELKELDNEKQKSEFEALKLEEGKITVFEIDFSKEFEKWVEPETGVVKKIIPVLHNGERKVFWLNTRNPLYKELLMAYKDKGQTLFKVIRTGIKKDTKYNLVKE